jgi:hypothetical protein
MPSDDPIDELSRLPKPEFPQTVPVDAGTGLTDREFLAIRLHRSQRALAYFIRRLRRVPSEERMRAYERFLEMLDSWTEEDPGRIFLEAWAHVAWTAISIQDDRRALEQMFEQEADRHPDEDSASLF